jgi:nucleoid-associated protein YgaU
VAGQLLNALKVNSTKPAASHEARLGIMVITILVFAFGFLVYHKMDMHQRKLTQAAIASNAVPQTETVPADPAADFLNPQVSSVNDPMVSLEALTDGSPFTDPGYAEAAPQELSNHEAQTSAEFRRPEPTQVTAESFSSLEEPNTGELPQSGFEIAAADTTKKLTPELPRNQIPDPEPAFPEPAFSEPAEARMAEVGASEPELSLDKFSPDELLESPRTESDNQVHVDRHSEAMAREEHDTDRPQFQDVTAQQLTEITEVVPQSDASGSSSELGSAFGDIPEKTDSRLADDSASEPQPVDLGFEPIHEESTVAPQETKNHEEPVLLAMADPQQASDDDLRFSPDDQGENGKFLPEEPAGLPGFSEREAGQHGPAKGHHRSDSQGFNAVKNPGGRKSGNTIRTAAGSGADGRFSLAAFNYQNGAAEPAPDDGSTFDSVVVQKGDNYTKISQRVYGTVRYFSALAVFNQHRIAEPKNMRPGMVVLVPDKNVLEERYPELFVDSKPKAAELPEFLVLEDGSPAYRVGEQETLSEISARFLGRSARWIEIYRLNQSILNDPNKLKAGLILALPADAVEVNVVP